MESVEKEIPKRAFLASIEYGDESEFYGELEHEIMPNLPFVFRIISHY